MPEAEKLEEQNIEQADPWLNAENAEEAASEEIRLNDESAEPEKEEKKKSFFSKKQGDQGAKEIKKLTDELETLKKSLDENRDKYLRLAADFENYKRRATKENEAKYLDSRADTVKQLLPIIDNFERAMKIEVPEDAKAYTSGYEMIYTLFQELLKNYNVEEIPALGEPFDINLHHAVMHVEDESLGESVVAEVFEKGYKMGDRVLRYSMVKVAN